MPPRPFAAPAKTSTERAREWRIRTRDKLARLAALEAEHPAPEPPAQSDAPRRPDPSHG